MLKNNPRSFFFDESTDGDICLFSKGSQSSSSRSYLFMFSFSNFLVSDVLGMVVEKEVKGLLTLVQPVSNLVRMLLHMF